MGGEFHEGKKSLVNLIFTGDMNKEAKLEHFIMGIGASFSIHVLNMNGKDIYLQIWNYLGKTILNYMRNSYFQNSKSMFFVYDCLQKETITAFEGWREKFFEQSKKHSFIITFGYNKSKNLENFEYGRQLFNEANIDNNFDVDANFRMEPVFHRLGERFQ